MSKQYKCNQLRGIVSNLRYFYFIWKDFKWVFYYEKMDKAHIQICNKIISVIYIEPISCSRDIVLSILLHDN